jgi:hypothetical protein
LPEYRLWEAGSLAEKDECNQWRTGQSNDTSYEIEHLNDKTQQTQESGGDSRRLRVDFRSVASEHVLCDQKKGAHKCGPFFQ